MGESNKMYWLFTKELGLVRAVATGVRKPAAKLRGQLVDYTFINVDLVKGRDLWRLISARGDFDPLEINTQLARPYVRTLATIERFLIDEGVHEELFEHILECGQYLNDLKNHLEDIDPKVYDTLAIWRTLVHLGYIAIEEDELPYFNLPFHQSLNIIDEETRKKFNILVNKIIKETHL